jgi:hypothetical protein
VSETAAPPTPPPAKFEDFMSDQIAASLKENPKIPSLNKNAPQEAVVPEGPKGPEGPKRPVIPETTPEQAAKALLPDFSKLAFGQPIEKVTETIKPEQPAHVPAKAPEHEEFPEEPPGAATPQAKDTWGKLRTSNQTLWKQNADLVNRLKDTEARLKEFDGKTPMATDEYEKLTGERDNLSKELRLVKLEKTPEYQRAVQQPMEAIESELKRLGTKYNIGAGRIREALVEIDRDKQGDLLSRVTETFNDRDKMNLFKLSDDAREIIRRKSVLQADVKQALEYIEAKRTAETERTKAESANEWNGAQKKAWKSLSDEIYLARPLEGNEQWNKDLDATKELVANTDLGAMPSLDRARILVQAALLPRALVAIHQLWNMYQEAAKGLQRYQGVTPGAGGGRASAGEGNGQAAPGSPSDDGMSFIDAIESKIKGVPRR